MDYSKYTLTETGAQTQIFLVEELNKYVWADESSDLSAQLYNTEREASIDLFEYYRDLENDPLIDWEWDSE